MIILGLFVGMYVVGFLGLYLRLYLIYYCLIDFELGEVCFLIMLNVFGWIVNVCC